MLHGVLKGLNALHNCDVVYESLNPNNIFLNESGEGVLGDYDFSKTPV